MFKKCLFGTYILLRFFLFRRLSFLWVISAFCFSTSFDNVFFLILNFYACKAHLFFTIHAQFCIFWRFQSSKLKFNMYFMYHVHTCVEYNLKYFRLVLSLSVILSLGFLDYHHFPLGKERGRYGSYLRPELKMFNGWESSLSLSLSLFWYM
jgi:hypothetical protein